MRITVTDPIAETGPHGTLPPGEYTAEHSTPTRRIDTANRRPGDGWFVTGQGKTYMVEYYDWDAAIDAGTITEVKEEDETMETTTAPGKICAALVKAQKAFGPALKTSTNPHYKSKYADLSACVEAVLDGLNSNGIALIQTTRECADGVIVATNFVHESGEVFSAGVLRVPAPRQDPQGFGSALTYARRYSLMTACGIAPEDDDGNAASANGKKPAAQPAPTQDDGLRHAEPQAPPPAANRNEATPAQKKKLFAMATEKFGSKENGLEFITWAKGDEPVWTKKMASELFDNFADQAALFADSKRAA